MSDPERKERKHQPNLFIKQPFGGQRTSRAPDNPSRLPPPAVAARQSPPVPSANPGNRQTSFSPPPPPPGGTARPPAPQASASTSAARYANAMDVDHGAAPAPGPLKATRLPPQVGRSAVVPAAAPFSLATRPTPQHPNGLGTGSLVNRSHPGLAAPRPPPTPDSQKLLETVVRRVVNLVPVYLAEHQAPPAAVLDTLWLDDEAREGFEKAYREKEKKASDERKVKMNAAYAQTASDMNTFLGAEFERLEPLARIVAVERAIEELRSTGGGSSAPQDGREPSPAGSVEHQRLVAELKQKVVTLESELQEQRSSAHVMQQQMDGLVERVKADVSAAWEARFAALEGKLSASAAVDRPSPNPPPAPAMTEEVVNSLATLEAKGRNLARGVGLPWEASEKSLGKRKMDGEGDEAEENAEREKSLVERLEGLRVEGGEVGKRVGVVEGRVEDLEAGERKAEEDVEMKEAEAAETLTALQDRLAVLEGTLNTLKSELATTTSTSTSLAPRFATLESSLGTLRDSVTRQETTLSSSTEINAAVIAQLRDNGKATNQAVEGVKAKVEEVEKSAEARADGLKKEVDELESKAAKLQDEALKKADEVQAFASYFMTQNRFATIDQMITAWSTANPAQRAALLVQPQAPTPPEDQQQQQQQQQQQSYREVGESGLVGGVARSSGAV